MPSSSPKLYVSPRKHRKPTAALQVLFLGLAVEEIRDTEHKYFLGVHDGVGIVQTHEETYQGGLSETYEHILELIEKYTKQRSHKIAIVSLSPTRDPNSIELRSTLIPGFFGVDFKTKAKPSFLSRVWLELDAIPFLVSIDEPVFSLQARAVAAVDKALSYLNVLSDSTLKIGTNRLRSVSIDGDFQVHLYDLAQQAALTSPTLWKAFTTSGQRLLDRKIKIHFFSATPSGGGVALMRHGLRRLWRMCGLDVDWFVPQGDSRVFNVTKRKMHNVLQGVAPKEVLLQEDDKKLFQDWTEWNYKTYWSAFDGPLAADIIVIDDPQLTALIPLIRRYMPQTKIVYRSHIEIRGDLLAQGDKQITTTWNYLWNFIKQADLFVAHPVESFVPQVVKDKLPVVYMPPSTVNCAVKVSKYADISQDLLDGLNKPIPHTFLNMYRHEFNETLRKSRGQCVDWTRPYIVQIARFDPSKDWPCVFFLSRGFQGADPEKTSVDDPDSTLVLHQLEDQLSDKSFDGIRDDIFAARSPPSDRLLNAILRGADVACQVSTREGYEIKVSEALHKGLWVIAARAGGLPLQCRDGTDSTLVEAANPKAICVALLDYYTKHKGSKGTGHQYNNTEHPVGGRFDDSGQGPSEENFTVANATMWHALWLALLDRDADLKELSGKKVWQDVIVKQFM